MTPLHSVAVWGGEKSKTLGCSCLVLWAFSEEERSSMASVWTYSWEQGQQESWTLLLMTLELHSSVRHPLILEGERQSLYLHL